MNTINLHNHQLLSTIIPNQFFDLYMPRANGEFVKVYLYLMRCSSEPQINLSITRIADKLNHTEADVKRALRYWEQEGLLTLSYDASHNLIDIALNEFPSLTKSNVLDVSSKIEETATIQPETAIPEKKPYTKTQLNQFLDSEDISQILYVAQRYLGKTLIDTEINAILYFYDSLHFPADLIEYLIEYCVSKDKKSMRYIEKVAIAWAEQGITTIEQAKNASNTYNNTCFAVMKAFGLSNRNPGDFELSYITKWTKEYLFSLDIILEACNRTIQKIHQPSFDYADSILGDWNQAGVKLLSDIQTLDVQFYQTKESQRNDSTVPLRSVSNNKFNNITPRSYLYDDLEKQLINH